MTDSHDIEKLLADAQRLCDAGDYDRARAAADRVLAILEHERRDESLEYSEAMRIFGTASYRAGDVAMADNTLTYAYNTRVKAGFGNDRAAKEILSMLAEVAILRNNHLRANRILERLREISE